MKTFKNKIVASALALSLVGGAVIANPKTAEAASKPLYIKKVLTLPDEGVTTPNETFTFKFKARSKNGDRNKAGEMPAIQDVKIAYTADDNVDNDTTKDGKQLIKESTDALAGVQWEAAGQYTYLVAETEGKTKDMHYSRREYRVSIFVKKTDKGGFEVENIFIQNSNGITGNSEVQEKTEYQPGGDDTKKEKNKFEFVNEYIKKGGNDNPGGGTDITDEDKKGFALRKTITGDNPDPNAEFTFKLKVDPPKVFEGMEKNCFYYIVDAQGTKGKEGDVNYGVEAKNIKLKHNERIVFKDIILGSTVTVDETDAGAYVGSIKSTFNGTAGTEKTGVIGDQAGGNFAEYKNTKQTATGLLIENLPFLALILVAGAGIIFFVKNKKEEELA